MQKIAGRADPALTLHWCYDWKHQLPKPPFKLKSCQHSSLALRDMLGSVKFPNAFIDYSMLAA
jgi:hypothetical protein